MKSVCGLSERPSVPRTVSGTKPGPHAARQRSSPLSCSLDISRGENPEAGESKHKASLLGYRGARIINQGEVIVAAVSNSMKDVY